MYDRTLRRLVVGHHLLVKHALDMFPRCPSYGGFVTASDEVKQNIFTSAWRQYYSRIVFCTPRVGPEEAVHSANF